MTRFAIVIVTLAALLAASLSLAKPAAAQTTAPEAEAESEEDSGDKMREGWQQFLDGLNDEVSPRIEALRDWADTAGPAIQSFLEEMGPALTEMWDDVKDWSHYEAPELLPNGDIIIRRKPDAPPLEPEESPAGDGAIDI